MKLKGYYMTAVCKFEDGIKTIYVIDAQNRAQLLKRLNAAYPGKCFKLYDYERTKFGVEVRNTDFVSIHNVLALKTADEVC